MTVRTSPHARRLVASLVAAAAFAARPAEAAEPSCEADDTVAIEVASELGDEGDDAAMREYLQARLPERLRGLGLCVEETAERSVVVTVAWSSAAHGDYAIALRAVAPDTESFEPSAVDCPGCATAEVLDTIAQQVPLALAGLHEAAASSAAQVGPAQASSPPPQPHDRERERERARLGRLGRAGIGLSAAGIAGIVTGAVLWARRSVPHPADSRYQLVLLPAGVTLVATGVVATAAGATMLALDRRRARSRHARVQPALTPSHVGVVISGSF